MLPLLLTLLIPLWLFEFLWLFILHDSSYCICILWTSTLQWIQYTWSTMIMWHMKTHDKIWHGIANMDYLVMQNFQVIIFVVNDACLIILLPSSSSCLGDKNLQWSQVLGYGHEFFICLDRSACMLSYKNFLFMYSSFISFFLILSGSYICNSLMRRWY